MRPCRAVYVATLVLAAHTAGAQETSVATARQLAISGIDAVESGDCEKGAPQLERAEQLHHASVHLQYLARCRVGARRLVAATEMWRRIIREGAPEGSSPAVMAALTEAQTELEKTLPRLASTTIRAAETYEGLSLTLDGTRLPADMVGAPQILDPGDHALTVSAPGFQNWQKQWKLAEGGSAEVVVELVALPEGAVAGTPAGEESTTKKGGAAPWLSPVGWVTASVGVASLIAGTVTLLSRNSRRSDLVNKCQGGVCSESDFPGTKLQDDIGTIEDLTTASNVLLWGGGALLAGGATMIVIASQGSGKEPQTALLVGAPRSTAGLTLQGRW